MSKAKFKITSKGLKYSLFHDLYYRMIKASWFNFFISASLIYILLNFIFALLYYLSPAAILNARPDSIWDAFVFSFQTSSTLGYGHFLPNTDTAHAIVILDTLIGIFYVAIITGMAFAKFARPSAQILFTDKMIIAPFDGVPTLMFRMANGRDTEVVDAKMNVAVLIPYTSTEGHQMRRFYKLPLTSQRNPTFVLTWTAMHPINEESPLYGIDLEQYEDKNITFFVSFTGIDSVLSQTIHANHRYYFDQVVKAKKFVDILKLDKNNTYAVDFQNFNETEG